MKMSTEVWHLIQYVWQVAGKIALPLVWLTWFRSGDWGLSSLYWTLSLSDGLRSAMLIGKPGMNSVHSLSPPSHFLSHCEAWAQPRQESIGEWRACRAPCGLQSSHLATLPYLLIGDNCSPTNNQTESANKKAPWTNEIPERGWIDGF